MESIFDFISVSHYFGKIERNCAVSMLRSVADEFVYSSYLSRNTNFRWSDHSSVFKSPNRLKYLRRLFDKEGEETVERILREKPIFQNQSHDQMRFVGLLLDAWPGTFKMIEVTRDPVDLIDAWRRRNWGTRFGADPMAVTQCIKFKGQAVPFHAHGWEQEYLESSPMDRIIKMLHGIQIANRAAYETLNFSDKKQILVLRFEDFVVDTYSCIDRLADFLHTKKTKTTKAAIQKQGCPRQQSQEKRQGRLEIIKREASSPYLELLDEMIEDYKTDWI
ncbi:hypothetical protein OBB02_00665 [Candidatus Puniceispirillum sp.]|nr:hypothetical protein [Candidatus Puniceispirillum sp.]